MTYSTINKTRGFTLVETIVYAFGVCVILAAIAAFIFYLSRWYRDATIPTRVDGAALALMSQIQTDLRGSNSLNDAMSQYATSTGWITMIATNGTNSTTTTHYLESGRIKSKIGSSATTTLSAADIWISQFLIKKLTTPNSTAIHIDLSIDYSLNNSTSTRTYSGLSILRQSY